MDTGYSKFYRGREALCVGLHPQLYIHMWHEAFSEANRSCLRCAVVRMLGLGPYRQGHIAKEIKIPSRVKEQWFFCL
jgi:hypothetical protein